MINRQLCCFLLSALVTVSFQACGNEATSTTGVENILDHPAEAAPAASHQTTVDTVAKITETEIIDTAIGNTYGSTAKTTTPNESSNTAQPDSALAKPFAWEFNSAKTFPSTASLNDLLMSDELVKKLVRPTKSSNETGIPLEIFMQMLLLDKMLFVDVTAALDSVCHLTNLRGLDLRGYQITELPTCISQLQKLEVLILDDNKLGQFPEWILQLPNLKYLSIQENGISTLPADIHELGQLQYLSLSYNEIKVLPLGFSQLTNLTYLDLSANANLQESTLTQLCNLKSLKAINLSSMGISSLPDCFWLLSNIKSLNISSTDIVEIPSKISQMKGLEVIGISNIPMNYAQAFEALQHCPRLSKLYAIGSTIDSLPASIGLLKNLESINFFDCDITYLPDEIGKLTNLTRINLSNNQLTTINPALFSLPKLEGLRLANNNLSSIPPSITNMKQLKRLSISGNNLTETNIQQLKEQLPGCEIE